MVSENFLKLHLKKKEIVAFYTELYLILFLKQKLIRKKIVVTEFSIKVNKLNITLHFIKF